jgi:hypothetical protein
MKIYIASSFRNITAVKILSDCLAEAGHHVLDWTDKPPPMPDSSTEESYKNWIDSDESGVIFDFCTGACAHADLIVYLGTAGQDAACEVGIAWTAGVPVYGFAGPQDRPGLILSRCVTRWFSGLSDFLDAVHNLNHTITNTLIEGD